MSEGQKGLSQKVKRPKLSMLMLHLLQEKLEWMMFILLRRLMVDSGVAMVSASEAMLAGNSIPCC